MDNGPITVKDKPVFEQVPLRDGYPSRPRDELEARHQLLKEMMARHQLESLLIFANARPSQDMIFFADWPGGTESYLLTFPDRDPIVFFQLYNHMPLVEKLSIYKDVRWAGGDGAVTVASTLKELGKLRGRHGFIGNMPHALYTRYEAAMKGCEIVDLGAEYRAMRLVKRDEELFWFKVAAEVTDRAIDALEREIRPGLREYELAAICEQAFLREGGYTGIHFISSMPMNAPAYFNPWQFHSNRVIEKGDVIITEITGNFWGYGGQIHRSFFLGEPTAEWVKIHDTAVKAYEAVENAIREGALADDLVEAGEVIHSEGYTMFDDIVHGAGLVPPVLRTKETQHKEASRTLGVADKYEGFVIRKNMVLTIQPQPVTLDWTMGLQFGETVWVTEDGSERLHHYPRKMVVID